MQFAVKLLKQRPKTSPRQENPAGRLLPHLSPAALGTVETDKPSKIRIFPAVMGESIQ